MRIVVASLVALALAACSTMTPTPASCVAGKPAVQTQLYFGLSTKSGAVSPREWRRFVEREITPRFPQGFSVADVRGAWLSEEAKRTISENSKLLIRVHDGTPADNAAITAIIDSYKRDFAQESVMRVDQNICVAF
ncbi:MAG: DUF3574 domain-containing protein [Alphaproteobacteria bacterium]|nr:DUF3574 domain-containing protein [Alphaproteobacteria bacterium]